MVELLGTVYAAGLLALLVGTALSSLIAALVVAALVVCFAAFAWGTMK